MGNKNFTRRHFFRKLAASNTANDLPDNNDDPLFQKYSRKKLTPRRYSTEEAQLKIGTEDKDEGQRKGAPVTSGLAPYTGQWTEQEALHLLRRTNFGWKKAWVDALTASGMTASSAVDAVLNISHAAPPAPVNWYENISGQADESALAGNNGTGNPAIGYGADWTAHYFPYTAATAYTGGNTNARRMESLRRWLFGLVLNGDVSIREKMVWFWFHFIPIDFQTIYDIGGTVGANCARIFYRYLKLFRDNATTSNPVTPVNFKELIKKVALEPAMMYYLNNNANTKTAPDENFARELMELFTIGKDDPNSGFDDQNDVIAAAKVLTGWRVEGLNTATVATNFKTANHEYAPKTFSAFFGGQTISSVAPNGNTELDALINMIFSKSTHVSRYICRRLYRYFVYYDIDANVEANVIVPLAQTFVANNWNIKPVLEQLFKSQHFFDMANRGCYIKSPFDLVAGFLNSFAVDTADAASAEYQYRIWSRFNDSYCVTMEQQMGSIPNVSGWNAYYQTPAYHQYWINSNAIQKRSVFIGDHFANNTGYTISGLPSTRKFKADTVAFAQQFGDPIARDPNALVAISIKYLLPIDISLTQRNVIKGATLLSGQTTDMYWDTAWANYMTARNNLASNPTNTAYQTAYNSARSTVETRLRNLMSTICQLAEYQLM